MKTGDRTSPSSFGVSPVPPEPSSRSGVSSVASFEDPLCRSMPGISAALLDRANFTGLVLGCIEAKICKKICVCVFAKECIV